MYLDLTDAKYQCLIDEQRKNWWRPYLAETSIVENYSSTSTNWYQLATWVQSREDSNLLNDFVNQYIYKSDSKNEDKIIEDLIINTWQQASQKLQSINKIHLRKFLQEYPGFDLAGSTKFNGGSSRYCAGADCQKVGCNFKESSNLASLPNNAAFTDLEREAQKCFIRERHSGGSLKVDLNDLDFVKDFFRNTLLKTETVAANYFDVPNNSFNFTEVFTCLKEKVLSQVDNDFTDSFNMVSNTVRFTTSGATANDVIVNLVSDLRSEVDSILTGCSPVIPGDPRLLPGDWTLQLNTPENRKELVNTLLNLDLKRTIDANKITFPNLLNSKSLFENVTRSETIWSETNGNKFAELNLDVSR